MKRPRTSNPKSHPDSSSNLRHQVQNKSARKLKARREEKYSLWYGLGLIGIVGWSVILPILMGIALGLWIDFTWPSRYSWTLMLLFVGVVLGCLNAWYWVQQESRDE
ncbi:MAG: AtpZ/AtpI family protein [Leptolyngbyaceae bacterium]|nr:AtpZ/AtpI family protein [Leptolyngbyaceae bacterium]